MDIDLNLGFDRRTGDINKVYGTEAINQHLEVMIMTSMGDVPYFNSFGSHVGSALFEFLDVSVDIVKDEIERLIEDHEPRIASHRVDVVHDGHDIFVSVKYRTVNGDNGSYNIKLKWQN